MQIVELYFFEVGYWSFVSFLWWCHICPILHDPCTLALVSVRLKEQTPLPVISASENLSIPQVDGIDSRITAVLY